MCANQIDKRYFLHQRPGVLTALGVALLLLIMDLVPLHKAPTSDPLWMKYATIFWIVLFIFGVVVLMRVIRSFWESVFLGIFVIDIALKSLLPPESARFFRNEVSPFLWCAAITIVVGVQIMSRKAGLLDSKKSSE